MQDLVFVVTQEPNEIYQRAGDDLIVNVRIPLVTALCEGKIDVPSVDGRYG